MKLYSIFLFFLFGIYITSAQNVVVSEYYNVTADPTGEWTELLVIADNTSLVGYTLRDNAGSSGTPNQWTGGIRFKDHPLWRNLRAGTIIVINHRYSAYQNVDVDKRDGYLEIDAENETYFDKRCFSCILGPDWYNVALNVAQESEIVELIDNVDNHVHALAHMPSPSGNWITMPEPKLSAQGSITRSGVSVRVAPGRNLQAYNKGFDARGEEVEFSPDYITKGKPNNRNSNLDQNQLYWRSLREPIWYNPTLEAKVFRDSVVISWNSSVDLNPADSTQGYLILRIPFAQLNLAQIPIDGRIYNVGDYLGSAFVVGVIDFSLTNRFVDKFSLPCGEKYVYRVYSYRYRADDLRADTRKEYARGRSYNEYDFAEIQVEKPVLPKPKISAVENKVKFCSNDSTKIILHDPERYSSVQIQWFLDETFLDSNRTEIFINRQGTYKVKLIDSLGCSVVSNEVQINVITTPKLTILVNNQEIYKDTSITICPKDTVILNVYGWTSFSWYKDGEVIKEGKESQFLAEKNGVYWVRSTNEICEDESYKVSVNVLDLSINYSLKSIDIYLDKIQSYKDTVINLTSNDNDTIWINKILFTDTSFQLLSPTLPILLMPKSSVDVFIRFQPFRSGLFSSLMVVEKSCDKKDTIQLVGRKEQSSLFADRNAIDFGVQPYCDGKEHFVYSDLTIFNVGEDDVEVLSCDVDKPFTIVNSKFPIMLPKKSDIQILFQYKINATGFDSGKIVIRFRINNMIDSLELPIYIEVIRPTYEVHKLFSEPIKLEECANQVAVKKISFVNKSKLPLEFIFPDSSNIVECKYNSLFLNPFDSSYVEFTIKPDRQGNFVESYVFKILPCDLIDTIYFSIKKNGFILKFEPEELDFGTLISCNPDTTFSSKIITKLIGTGYTNLQIDSIWVDPPFSTNLSTGIILQNNEEYFIYFKPSSTGDYSGILKMYISPCDITVEIPIKAKVEFSSFTIDSLNIDFNDVEIGSTFTKKIIIHNKRNLPIILNRIDGINPPFYMVEPKALPIQIDSSDSVVIEIKFEPDSTQVYFNILNLTFGYPCYTTKQIFLTGRGVQPFTDEILIFGEEIHSKPFRIIQIPIKLSYNQYNNLKLSTLSFEVLYNYRLFNLYGISLSKSIIYADTTKSKGKIYFHLTFDSTEILQSDFVGSLTGMVMFGDTRSTDFTFENAQAAGSKSIVVRSRSGRLITDSVCIIDLRLVQIENVPIITNFVYNQDYLKISLSNLTDDLDFKIIIFNILGDIVLEKHIQLNNSEKEISIPINFLNKGIYYVNILLWGRNYFEKLIHLGF